MAPKPKVPDPTLSDLRPLMFFEVLRKIWTGVIMEKIKKFWTRWGLIDERQHGLMGGKGTHSAIPILINSMETAKDFTTDMYLSSWDIKRAFDSLGMEFVLWALERMHIPKELATYLVSIDKAGMTFVRTPLNEEINGRGRLKEEGLGFERGKRVGQGDVSSPLLWVAVFDMLLTALKEIKNEFKTQDIDGRTVEVPDIAFADDLISITATIEGLQRKADIISGWCMATGVKVAVSKLRTFGIVWGVDKGKMETIVLTESGGGKKEVEVKADGIMTHLGITWNMDMYGDKQWKETKKVIERMGEVILRGTGRMRDKITTINYCLKATVLYRMQHCTWGLDKYKKLDIALNKILRKVTKNMSSYPGAGLMIDKEEGGLGLTAISDIAQDRKIKMLMSNIDKDDASGHAFKGMIGRGHRDAGNGGMEDTEMIMEDTLGKNTWMTSLIQWLGEMRIYLRSNGSRKAPELATKVKEGKEKKIMMNKRGIVLRS